MINRDTLHVTQHIDTQHSVMLFLIAFVSVYMLSIVIATVVILSIVMMNVIMPSGVYRVLDWSYWRESLC